MKRFLLIALIALLPCSAWAARSFTANTDRINCSTCAAPTSSGSISIWVKPNWGGGDSTVHEFYFFPITTGGNDRLSFQKFSDNSIYAGWNITGTDERIIIAGSSLFTSGQWANWVLTWSASGCVLYKNGVSVGTKSAITVPSLATSYSIGSLSGGGHATNASMAEFAIWTSVLSANEALALAKGANPLQVRPTNIQFYVPILGIGSGEPDWGPSHVAQTVSGPVFAVHAPVQPYPQVRYGQ